MSARPQACRWLRARGSYGPFSGSAPWGAEPSSLECYWCLCTMEAAGPDDRLADGTSCRPGRSCFAGRDGSRPASPGDGRS